MKRAVSGRSVRPACPACGSLDVVPISYGLPSPDTAAKAEAGEVHLGGCVVDGEDRELRCKACEHEFSVAWRGGRLRQTGATSKVATSRQFVGDESTTQKAVGAAIRDVVSRGGSLKMAVAYVTEDFRKLFDIPVNARSVTLICDPWSGACNPFVLRDLCKVPRTTLLGMRGLHAKSIIAEDCVVVGSANLSSPGLTGGNIEALAVLRDSESVAAASAWFDGLRASAIPLRPLLEATVSFQALVKGWRRQQGKGGGAWKPTILEALEARSPLLAPYLFELYYEAADVPTATMVERAAKTLRRQLPRQGTWTAYGEEASFGDAKAVLGKMFVGGRRKQIGLRVALDKAGRIWTFKSVDPEPKRFFDVIRVGRVPVSVFETDVDPHLNFRGGDRSTLCKRLTAGVAAQGRLLATIQRRHAWLMTPSEVRKLIDA